MGKLNFNLFLVLLFDGDGVIDPIGASYGANLRTISSPKM